MQVDVAASFMASHPRQLRRFERCSIDVREALVAEWP